MNAAGHGLLCLGRGQYVSRQIKLCFGLHYILMFQLLSWFVLVEAYCELPTDVVKINKPMESLLLSFVFVKCPENCFVSCIFY